MAHQSTPDMKSREASPSIPPLGLTSDAFIEAASSAATDIAQYYDNLPSRNVLPSIAPGYLRKLLPEDAPQHGEAWDAIQQDIERTIMPGMTHWQHPKFMAFFPASSTYPSMLGELWSAALAAPAFNWICSPAVTELETIVMDWMAKMLALPEGFLSKGEGGGTIQLSASDAIATVMVAARERWIRRQLQREGVNDEEEIEDRSCELRGKLVALGTDQSHSSAKKAATIAGTRYRSIAAHHSDGYALKGHEVRKKIQEVEAKGLHPYFLVATVGTTNTCAIDDLVSIAEVVRDYPDIWIHVDAAYAGTALILPENQYISKQFSFIDSFNMNMHKWLLVNFDASLLFVQKRRDLTDALSITPAYLKNSFTDSGLVTDYRDWQIPLGRRFRALKIWFVIRTWGVEGMQAYVRRTINLGNTFADLIRSRSDLFTILSPPRFALTVFIVKASSASSPPLDRAAEGADPRPDQDRDIAIDPVPEGSLLRESNEATKAVYEIIDKQKEFFLTSSVVGNVFAIRVVSANPLAEEKYLRQLFNILVATVEESRGRRARDGKL